MENAEAEAVLLALGPQLTWREPKPGSWWGESDGVRYEVFTGDTGRTIALCDTGATGIVYYRHKETGRIVTGTPSSLRAACERHYATGKWE